MAGGRSRVARLRSGWLRVLCGSAAAFALASAAQAACTVSGDGDTPPAWARLDAPEDAALVSAVGSAPIDGDRLPEALASARTQALKELAERIRVSVSSSVKLNDSKVSEGGKQVLRSSIESVAEATTNVTLQNVRADQQWVDARRCTAWVRVSVSRAEFERARKRDVLLGLSRQVSAMLALAEDASKPLPQRESSAAAAAALLDNDYRDAPEVPVAALKARLGGVHKMLGKMKQDETRLLGLAQTHVQAYAEFKSTTNPVERLEAAGRALRPLRTLLAAAWVPDEAVIGFAPQARLVSLLDEAGYPCLARKAANEASTAACSAADLAQERQKEYFAGRPVQLSCSLRVAGKTTPWTKACASLGEALAKLGARTDAAPAKSPKSGKLVVAGGVTQIRLNAEGRVAKRQDPEDKSTAYRFEGAVSSQVRGLDSPIDDNYQALTGWNPVSEAMTTDILALSAARRLIERMGQAWQ